VLHERYYGVFKDTDDTLPSEEWKGSLEQLISETAIEMAHRGLPMGVVKQVAGTYVL
jgi:hypothetical protein